MRTQETNKRTSTAMALALGILMVTLATPAPAAVPPVSVVGTSVSGSSVYVTIRNNSLLPQVKTVAVQVALGDTAVWSFAPVTLLPYQTMTVRTGFTSVVTSLTKCGVTDEATPF